MIKHHYSCAAEQAELVSHLDAAVAMGKASLHDCRQLQGGQDATAGANKRLRLQQLQVCERERHMARRLDVVLHTNHSLRGEIARLRDDVLRDRNHCSTLLQRHATVVEATTQYTNSLQLEKQTSSVNRSIKQKVDSTTKTSQVRATQYTMAPSYQCVGVCILLYCMRSAQQACIGNEAPLQQLSKALCTGAAVQFTLDEKPRELC